MIPTTGEVIQVHAAPRVASNVPVHAARKLVPSRRAAPPKRCDRVEQSWSPAAAAAAQLGLVTPKPESVDLEGGNSVEVLGKDAVARGSQLSCRHAIWRIMMTSHRFAGEF